MVSGCFSRVWFSNSLPSGEPKLKSTRTTSKERFWNWATASASLTAEVVSHSAPRAWDVSINTCASATASRMLFVAIVRAHWQHIRDQILNFCAVEVLVANQSDLTKL